jgi:hypothetical protein
MRDGSGRDGDGDRVATRSLPPGVRKQLGKERRKPGKGKQAPDPPLEPDADPFGTLATESEASSIGAAGVRDKRLNAVVDAVAHAKLPPPCCQPGIRIDLDALWAALGLFEQHGLVAALEHPNKGDWTLQLVQPPKQP